MVAFATLLLGLVAGEVRIDLLVTPPARAVELFVDGRPCGRRAGPPWSIACDLGETLRPRRLVAVAYDGAGGELARAEQRLNVDRPEAALSLLVVPVAGRLELRLAAASAAAAPPREVIVELDGERIPAADPERVALPPLDLSRPHLLRVEAAWSERVRAAADAVVGGEFGAELTSELTAVPLRVAAVERGAGELWVVAHPDQFDRLARVTSRRGLSSAVGGLDWRSVGSLAPDDRIRVVWPWPERREHDGRAHELFLPSPAISAREGGLPWILARARLPPVGDGPPRLASAAAVAGMSLAGQERRRAVLVLLDGDDDGGDGLAPPAVRAYLDALRVPLHAWRLRRWRGDGPDPWAPVRLVDSAGRFAVAAEALADDLESQRIVWLDGAHLPTEIALAADAEIAFAAGPAETPTAESSADLEAPADGEVAAVDAARLALAAERRAVFDRVFGDGTRRTRRGELEVAVAADVALSPERLAELLDLGQRRWSEALGMPAPSLDGACVGVVARLADHPDLAGRAAELGARAQAAGGVAVLAVEGRPPDEVEALALHELSHLLAERAFARPLPVWLEEGLAEQLARFDVGPGARRRRGVVERLVEPGGVRTRASGPLADLLALARDAERGALPALAEWTALGWREFVAPERRARHYALAGELVEFLLVAESERAAPLRAGLARAARDPDRDVDAEIAVALGDAAALDALFRAWLVAERGRVLASADGD